MKNLHPVFENILNTVSPSTLNETFEQLKEQTSQEAKTTVREATAMAFKRMPDEFSTNNLIAVVRRLTGRPGLHDGSILRRLRELRDDKICLYKVKDSLKSQYKKIKSDQKYTQKKLF